MSSLVANRCASLSFTIPTSDLSRLSSWSVSITPFKIFEEQTTRCGQLFNLAKSLREKNDVSGTQRVVEEYHKVSKYFDKFAPITILPSSVNAYTVTHRDFTTELTDSYDLAVEADKNVTFSISCQTGEYKILFVAYAKEAPDNPIRKLVSDVNLTACQVFKTNLALAECSSKQENC